jgi:NedA-like, galactose-binding domain
MPTNALCFLVVGMSVAAGAQELPKEALLDFANTRYQACFHYNTCAFKSLDSDTYHGRAHGDDPVSRWHPTGLDCEQWAQVCLDANLAFMRTARQSSMHAFIRDKRAYPRAEIAVDGVLEGNGLMEQTSMTKEEEGPWWQVDLERTCRIDTITIYHRTDTGRENLKRYWVTVMDDQGATVWRSYQESRPDPSVALAVGGVAGRTIKIQLQGKASLCIAEVVVTGTGERR